MRYKIISILHVSAAWEACELLKSSLQGVQRKRITNWRAYVYSLIRKVDEGVYQEMKESREQEKRAPRRHSKSLLDETPASAPSKKEFNKSASEFVPGQPWKTEVQGKGLRKEAATFVPTAAAVPPLFQAPMMPVQAAEWASPNGGKSITMKPDAQEFFPGVSAWAGAMVMNKGNGKAKVKAKPKAKKAAQPVSPGLQSPLQEDQPLTACCREIFADQKAVLKDGRVVNLLSQAECEALLQAAKDLGFERSPMKSKDPWLAGQVWDRLSQLPRLIQGKKVLGVEEDFLVHYGARDAEHGFSLQISLAGGDAYIRPPPQGDGSWLTALLRCTDRTWLDVVQEVLGPKRILAVVATTAAVAVLMPLLRKRLK